MRVCERRQPKDDQGGRARLCKGSACGLSRIQEIGKNVGS